MNDYLTFPSRVESFGFLSEYSQVAVKREPMLFSADADFACQVGGDITREFIERLPQGWRHRVVIDSRTHMLMPGWYPCIPGWHLDDIPRTRPDGQPDHTNPEYKAEHIMAVVGDASLTEFIQGNIRIQDVPVGGGVIYGIWNETIEKILEARPSLKTQVRDREIIGFDWQSFHRGIPATKNGWRFFIRATINTNRKIFNELRTQVQVYLPAPMAGW